VIPLQLMKSRQFILPDGGRGIFSPIYVDDLIDGVVLAAGLKQGAGQIFSLTSGAGVTCAEFFGHHWRWLGRQGSIPSLPKGLAIGMAETVGKLVRLAGRETEMGRGAIGLMSRPGTYSIEKARRLLGFDPKVNLAEGMRRSEAWARAAGLF
jgi:nucleoside-diphosphate-sugar epimerase